MQESQQFARSNHLTCKKRLWECDDVFSRDFNSRKIVRFEIGIQGIKSYEDSEFRIRDIYCVYTYTHIPSYKYLLIAAYASLKSIITMDLIAAARS